MPLIKPTDWIQTYSGKKFNPANLWDEDISIEDIAHALSLTCRFAGHTKWFYSVAQHSVMVSRLCSYENKMWGLLHDASEAYIGDMPAPLKHSMMDYMAMEDDIMYAILRKYGLSIEPPFEVKEADKLMCRAEAHKLLRKPLLEDWAGPDPMPEWDGHCWSPYEAEQEFLAAYNEIKDKQYGIAN